MISPRLKQLLSTIIGTFLAISFASVALVFIYGPTVSAVRFVAFSATMFAVTGTVVTVALSMLIIEDSQRRERGSPEPDLFGAELLADNYWADGKDELQGGRGCALYRTAGGSYLAHFRTVWQGERDSLKSLTQAEAVSLYRLLPNRRVPL